MICLFWLLVVLAKTNITIAHTLTKLINIISATGMSDINDYVQI